jgi:tRNA (mo5U34)-methyltransferase
MWEKLGQMLNKQKGTTENDLGGDATLEERVLSQKWFYRYELPGGRVTEQYIPAEVDHIHTTRLEMMFAALEPDFKASDDNLTAIDFSSHQGFFSLALAKRCKSVLGLEYQRRHVESAKLIRDALGVKNVEFREENLETMAPGKYSPADIVICFGLLYNLENPIAVLRRARELTKRVLLIETQTTILDLEGAVDSGHSSNTNYMHGYFGLFSGNPDNIDGSASDIVFYPSPRGLLWLLKKLGFREARILPPPPGAYQQLATGKRIMVEARL